MTNSRVKTCSVGARQCVARRCRLALVIVALGAVTGCEFNNAEFMMRDRPQMTETRGKKTISFYVVHVGDAPMLAFRSKLYFCDYAIMHDSTTGANEDCGPDLGGAFEWPYEFDKVSPPGDFTTLEVKAYARKGKRDYMPYRGKVMELEAGTDPADSFAAKAQILVRVYQSRLEIPVDLGGKEPLWHAARLEMSGRGVRKRWIRYSSEPTPGSFTADGPDANGRYTVVYEPTIKDIDPTGVTKALLKVPDEDGRFHDFKAELRPPTGGVREGNLAPADEGNLAPAGDQGNAPVSMPADGDGAADDGGTPVSSRWQSGFPTLCPGFDALALAGTDSGQWGASSLSLQQRMGHPVAASMLAFEGKHGTRAELREGILAPAKCRWGARDG